MNNKRLTLFVLGRHHGHGHWGRKLGEKLFGRLLK